MVKIWQLSANEVVEKVSAGGLKAEEVVQEFLERIEEVDSLVNAFITVAAEQAFRQAREIDRQIAKGKREGRLLGVPVAVKDNICTEGVRTTCASKMLEGYVPPYDATVVERIRHEGGIIIGKTNLDEFAMGSSTETGYFGSVRNPWNLEFVAGGSSGGSAVAIATGEVALALGSDTGGSIRCPASFCAVVGLKPTYGLVSRYGLVAYANSLEQIGPFARNVADCALLLSVIAGRDGRDSTCISNACDYTRFTQADVIEDLRIGFVRELLGEGVDVQVTSATKECARVLEKLGAECGDISLPSLEHALAAYYLIAMSEASSNLAKYDGVRYGYGYGAPERGHWSDVFAERRQAGFGPEVKRRIILGTFALSAGYWGRYYLKALKIRTLIRRDFQQAFQRFDALVGPTMPILPFKLGEKVEDPLSLYMCDVHTVPINMYGGPAISIPCGFARGLPIGIQIIGKLFDEETVLQIASALERELGIYRRLPITPTTGSEGP